MIKPYLVILLCIAIFYCLGTIVMWLLRQKPLQDSYADAFVRLLLGFVSMSTIFAIIKTNGNTISWGFLIVGGIYLSQKKLNGGLFPRRTLREFFLLSRKDIYVLGVSAVVGLLSVVGNGIFYYDLPFNNEPHFDYTYYAAVADEMTLRGVESNNIMRDVLWQQTISPTPYHYVELWIVSLISLLSGLNSTETIFIVVYSLLAVMYVLGLLAIAMLYGKNFFFYLLALISIVYVPVAYFDYTIGFNLLHLLKLDVIFTTLINTKTLVVALFFTFSMLLYKYNKNYFLISLLCLPIVNIVLAPSVFITVGTMLLMQGFKCNKTSWIILAETVTLGILIVCFYFFQSQANSMGNFSVQNIEDNVAGISSIIKSILKLIMFLVLYHVPIVIAVFYLWWRKAFLFKDFLHKNGALLLTVTLLLISGFVMAQLTKGVRDNTQFYALTTEFLPLVYAVVSLNLLSLATGKWMKIIIITFCMLFALFSCKYQTFQVKNEHPFSTDDSFLSDVLMAVDTSKSPIVVTTNPQYTYPYPISVSEAKLKTIYIGERDLYNPIPSTFTLFADSYGENIPIDTLQVNFVKHNKIKYIYTTNEQLYLNCCVVDTIFYERGTNNKFIVLN